MSSEATIEVLNNDQSVNLIPEMRSCDYKFLNPRSRDREISPRIAVTNDAGIFVCFLYFIANNSTVEFRINSKYFKQLL